jgi:hypothetical protein
MKEKKISVKLLNHQPCLFGIGTRKKRNRAKQEDENLNWIEAESGESNEIGDTIRAAKRLRRFICVHVLSFAIHLHLPALKKRGRRGTRRAKQTSREESTRMLSDLRCHLLQEQRDEQIVL